MTPRPGFRSRREVLRLGAGAAALLSVAGVAGCSDTPTPTSAPVARPSAAPPDLHTGPRFAGDPGPGRLYFGSSIPHDQPADATADGTELRISMSRRFYRPGQGPRLTEMARLDREAGILPFVSIKPPWTWRSVASGAHDDWARGLLAGLVASGGPTMLAVHHEPENDVTAVQTPAAWVAMQQHLMSLAEQWAPSVTVVPVLMQYTFDPFSGRTPEEWLVRGTALQGIDVYNPWTPSTPTDWVSFADMVDRVRMVVGDRPIIVPEYGCHSDPANPHRTQAWFRNAFNYAVDNDIVGLAYFDSEFGDDNQSWLLDPTGRAALRSLARRPEIRRRA